MSIGDHLLIFLMVLFSDPNAFIVKKYCIIGKGGLINE